MTRMTRRRKKKQRFILLICFFICFSFGLFFVLFQTKIHLVKDLHAEIFSDVSVQSFIQNIAHGKIVSEDEKIDTSHLGKQTLHFTYSNFFGKKKDYTFTVDILDTEAPVILASKEITTFVDKDIDLTKDVTVSDNSKETISVQVSGEYDIHQSGTYALNFIAKDSSANETIFPFSLNVTSDPNNYSFTTSKGFSGVVIDGVTYIDGVLVVNKTYALPSTYGSNLTTETKDAFAKMQADALALGLNLYISSGYRSYDTQDAIYHNYVKRDGQEKADTYSARAGHSEHQTGLAFDLNSISDAFTDTPEGKWVHENCYRYGFLLRYPKGKESITGYKHESWHLRYVGEELARKLYNDGDWITLEEYFGISSVYS